jgi:hypothetical protein
MPRARTISASGCPRPACRFASIAARRLSSTSRERWRRGGDFLEPRLSRTPPPLSLPLPPLPCTQPCTELRTSRGTGRTKQPLRTAWTSQILSLFTDHNPRVAGSSPASGMKYLQMTYFAMYTEGELPMSVLARLTARSTRAGRRRLVGHGLTLAPSCLDPPRRAAHPWLCHIQAPRPAGERRKYDRDGSMS